MLAHNARSGSRFRYNGIDSALQMGMDATYYNVPQTALPLPLCMHLPKELRIVAEELFMHRRAYERA